MSDERPPNLIECFERPESVAEVDSLDALKAGIKNNPKGWFYLNLHSKRMGTAAIKKLAKSPALKRVIHLDLGLNSVGNAGLAAVVGSPHIQQLQILELSWNDITAEGMTTIASSPNLGELRKLDLEYNQIGPAGAKILAASASMPQLFRLDLRRCYVEDEGAIALATSETLTALRELTVLNANRVTAEGCRVLGMSRLSRWWRKHHLEELGAKDLKALAKANGLRGYSKLKKDALIPLLLDVVGDE